MLIKRMPTVLQTWVGQNSNFTMHPRSISRLGVISTEADD